jgi:D-alanine-D-alanine ligase
MLLPHRLRVTLLLTYVDPARADDAEAAVRKILGRRGPTWSLDLVSDRPPMIKRPSSRSLAKRLVDAARTWDIPLALEESVWPSVAGLAPESVGVVCGVGPVARELYTPNEAVQRISVIQRTLLLAQFLLRSNAEKE